MGVTTATEGNGSDVDIYELRIAYWLVAIRSFADRDTETVWLDRVRRFQSTQAQTDYH